MKITKEEAYNMFYNAIPILDLNEEPIETVGGVYIPKRMILDCRKGKTPVNKIEFSGGEVVFEKVHHGHWLWSPKATDGTLSGCCSNCSFSHVFMGGHTAQYRYCPKCGAKMEISSEEESEG